ncbi:DUF411 domain-containing protein [Aestuariivirga sp.]|uniref:DUF411 domain-containing protein n=1 Tax=Aestuariivirga sp. TaxID=2650926 RepID=UPI00359383D5
MILSRRTTLLLPLLLFMNRTAEAGARRLEVMSTNGCGCCVAWVKHLEAEGYTATVTNLPMADLVLKKMAAGLRPELYSCHTAMIDGYVIEGHVPVRDINQLLRDRPDAIGLTVPGMPTGSPGMGEPDPSNPYEVLLVRRDGTTDVFSRQPQAG